MTIQYQELLFCDINLVSRPIIKIFRFLSLGHTSCTTPTAHLNPKK